MNPRLHCLRGTKVCSFVLGSILAFIHPAFSQSTPAADPPAQAVAADQPSADANGERKPSPHFQGNELPIPPQQGQPWTPPVTGLPQEVVDAVKTVFDEGLADPRGCEYREINVAVGDCQQGDAGVVSTHGWVLPGKAEFAVCWNGLVYPIVSAGAAADLHADIASLLLVDQQTRQQNKSGKDLEDAPDRSWIFMEPYGIVRETVAISARSMLPFKAVLLLRLVEGGLAATLWSQWFDAKDIPQLGTGPGAGMPSSTKLAAEGSNALVVASKDPYLWLAKSWAWAEFDRAVTAHMRGDDHLALVSARTLVSIQAVIESEAGRRRFAPDNLRTQIYLEFLGQLPDLIADSARRMAEAPYTPVLDMANPPSGSERIAGLIRDLELVSARQMSQPGDVALGGSPILQALMQEGEPAIEPLLQCLEKDQRLTRSVHFWRDFSTDRAVLGVHEAAYEALTDILQTDFYNFISTSDDLTRRGPEGRRTVADAIRIFWKKYGRLTMPQRWYAMLCDFRDPYWYQALDSIVQTVDVPDGVAVSPKKDNLIAHEPPNPQWKPVLQGESLRTMAAPSISELLVRRLREIEQQPVADLADAGDPNGPLGVRFAIQTASALLTWDGPNQLLALRKCSAWLRAVFDHWPPLHGLLCVPMSFLYEKRAELGDETALEEYLKWLAVTTPEGVDNDAALALWWPAWLHPDSPAVEQTVADLFSDRGAWSHPIRPDQDFTKDLVSLCLSPLVGLPSFRDELLRRLRDKGQIGQLEVSESAVSWQSATGQGWSSTIDGQSSMVPTPGSHIPLRSCDLYAACLGRLPGAPDCEPYWPEPERDEAVAKIAAYLEAYGDNLRHGLGATAAGRSLAGPELLCASLSLMGPSDWNAARLFFPTLDHPAVPEDVRDHRAIFALEGERRLWKPPQAPNVAIWRPASGSPEGFVTLRQAEEVFTDGKWERFFGVVAAHRIVRVPAAEIEFTFPDWESALEHQWTWLDGGFDAALTTPHTGGEWEAGDHAYDPFAQGQPLPAALIVRNRRGLDQTPPADLFKQNGDTRTLPPGVKLTLYYSPKMPPSYNPKKPKPKPDEMAPWTEVPSRAESPAARSDTGTVTMASTEVKTVFEIDLRDLFDLSRRGSYRLRADFRIPGVLVGQPEEATFTILPPP